MARKMSLGTRSREAKASCQVEFMMFTSVEQLLQGKTPLKSPGTWTKDVDIDGQIHETEDSTANCLFDSQTNGKRRNEERTAVLHVLHSLIIFLNEFSCL